MKVMKQKLFILFALIIATMTASATDDPTYSLTKANGAEAHGSITFKVGDNTVTSAKEGDVVTMIVNLNSGWAINEVSGRWYAAVAATRGVGILNAVTLTPVTGETNKWTFTMERANVEINCTYKAVANTAWIQLGTTEYTYDGTAKQPSVTVKFNTETTIDASEYTVAYVNNVNVPADAEPANAPKVTITFKSTSQNYTGEAYAYFTINPAKLTELTLTTPELTYAYKELTVEAASVKAGNLTVPADGYDLTGNKAKDAGNYTATATGKGNYTGTATAAWVIKENDPKADVDAKETTDDAENDGKDVDDVKMEMAVAENAATEAHTETREIVNPETGQTETVEVTVIPVVLESISIPATATAQEITVTVPSEIVNGNVIYQVTEIKADAFKQAEGANQKVTKVILPETEEPIKIAEGALKPDGELIEVVTPLALLDDYATTETMQETFEAKKISATVTAPNKFWTFSSGVDCILPEGVTVYKAIWDAGQPRIVELTKDELEVDGKPIIKANNGVLIASVKGNAYEIVANPGNQDKNTKLDPDKDANSYEGNCLMPTIESHNFTPASNYLIMKDNKFHTMSGSGKVPACKAVFSLVKAGVK